MAILNHTQLETVWSLAGGAPQWADTAAAVAQAESGGDTSKINNTAFKNRPGYHKPSKGAQPEYSVGLWQINELAHPGYTTTELLTATGNAAAAVAISNDGQDWKPWTTFKNGTYAKFLTTPGSTVPQPGSVPANPADAVTAKGHSGYVDLRWTVAKHLNQHLVHSRRITDSTFRLLAAKRKVRH